jgi:cyclase
MAVPRQFDMPCDAYMTTKSEEATVLTQDTNLSLVPSAEANDMANNDGFAKHSFPPNGLVALSRIAYQQTPLLASEVRPGVFVFTGAGGNVTAIAGSPGCTVVDTGFGPRLGEIERSIAAALAQAPRWLINTHWHFDHTDGNSAFAAAGATILAHANCRFRLSRNQYVPSLSWSVSAAPRGAWPTLTFEGPLMLDIGTEQLRLLPQAPAHTDGDIAVFLPSSNVLIMGDLFINGSYPVIDESSGGSLRGMVEALEELLAMIDAKYHCGTGHGVAADRTKLLGFCDMLRTIEDRIVTLIEAKLDIADIVAAQPTAEFDSLWGRGYVAGADFTRMVLAGMGLVLPPAAPPPSVT